LDSNFLLVTADAGFASGSEITSVHERLAIPQITITDPGYIYIFVANESEVTRVWFDDLKVTHQRSNIVAGADYYPFGLPMENREITREDYRYGYQGQYAEKDKETGWNAFELRMYDARIGRWTSIDPDAQFWSPYLAMGNNPVIGIDKKGSRVYYKTLAEANRTALNLNSIFKGKYGIDNAVSIHKKIIPGTKEDGFYLEFNKDVNVDELGLKPIDEFNVKSFKNALEADTDILGEIVDPSTPAKGLGTVGSNKGFTFSSTNFKIPNNLPDFNPKSLVRDPQNKNPLPRPNIGSQTLHELLWHISPAGSTYVEYGYPLIDFNQSITGVNPSMGTHNPKPFLINGIIPKIIPKFPNRSAIRTPRYRH
jgi:RHS repeat-associated protein